MSIHGSNDSLYKSAPSSTESEGVLDERNGEEFDDHFQRPNFLSRTSESSLIQVRGATNFKQFSQKHLIIKEICFYTYLGVLRKLIWSVKIGSHRAQY